MAHYNKNKNTGKHYGNSPKQHRGQKLRDTRGTSQRIGNGPTKRSVRSRHGKSVTIKRRSHRGLNR